MELSLDELAGEFREFTSELSEQYADCAEPADSIEEQLKNINRRLDRIESQTEMIVDMLTSLQNIDKL